MFAASAPCRLAQRRLAQRRQTQSWPPSGRHRGSGRHPRALRLVSVIAVVVVSMAALTRSIAALGAQAPYRDASAPAAARVNDLLSRMSLDDKIGQMTQVDRGQLASPAEIRHRRLGSVVSADGAAPVNNTATGWADMVDATQQAAAATPLGIPLLYGINATHGHDGLAGATIFPHEIGLGATRDPDLTRRVGRAVAEEVAATGVDWAFAPCLCVARNDRWGRTYESFGEDPALGVGLSTMVTGLQGRNLGGPASVLATAKYFIGDGGTTDGHDQGDAQLSEADLRRVHLPPFKAAIEQGVGAVLVADSSWNSARLPSDRYLITDVLKGELGFTGLVLGDLTGIDRIDGQVGVTQAEIVTAINAGIDMVRVDDRYERFLSYLRSAVQFGQIPMSRVDDANRRILMKKVQLGLFEHPYAQRSLLRGVGGEAHRALAREAVRKSLVLLKNADHVLPLDRSGGKYFVAGKSADNIGNTSGGWTMSWQGRSGAVTTGTTVLDGIRNAVGPGTDVAYSRDGAGINSSYRAAIAVVGETPYAEGEGDRADAMRLDTADLQTLARLRESGVPLIVVLVSGRPLDITAEIPGWNALVAAWLPGTEGAGVSDVLFGDANPTGKLPLTWMLHADQQPINAGDGKPALFPLRYGLSYPSGDPQSSGEPPLPQAAPATNVPANPPSEEASRPASTGAPAPQPPAPTVAPPPAPTAPAPAQFACAVTYHVVNQWDDGFTAKVTIAITESAMNGWRLTFTLPGDQSITTAWDATTSQDGQRVVATSAAWTARVEAGSSTSFGFNGSYRASNAPPVGFSLNGVACGSG
jgi:beta-glucosidase